MSAMRGRSEAHAEVDVEFLWGRAGVSLGEGGVLTPLGEYVLGNCRRFGLGAVRGHSGLSTNFATPPCTLARVMGSCTGGVEEVLLSCGFWRRTVG